MSLNEQPDNLSEAEENASHWKVLRDVLAFQFKLAMDGLRDVLLSPISILAALLGILTSPSNPGKYLYRLMKFGYRTDKWINLFGAYDEENAADTGSSDHFVRRAEEIVLNEYRKGGAMHEIKRHTDGMIDKFHARNDAQKDQDGNQ